MIKKDYGVWINSLASAKSTLMDSSGLAGRYK